MSLAFDKSTVVKEYKDEIGELQKDNDALAKKVANLTMEKGLKGFLEIPFRIRYTNIRQRLYKWIKKY